MHKSIALALTAVGVASLFFLPLLVSIGLFAGAAFSYYLGARVEGEE